MAKILSLEDAVSSLKTRAERRAYRKARQVDVFLQSLIDGVSEGLSQTKWALRACTQFGMTLDLVEQEIKSIQNPLAAELRAIAKSHLETPSQTNIEKYARVKRTLEAVTFENDIVALANAMVDEQAAKDALAASKEQEESGKENPVKETAAK